MSGLGEEVRERGRAGLPRQHHRRHRRGGFAIGSAALTALAPPRFLRGGRGERHGRRSDMLSVTNPAVLVGLFVGAMLVFVFGALTMSARCRGPPSTSSSRSAASSAR